MFINGEEARYTPLTADEVTALEVENKPQYEFYREEIGTMNHIVMLRRDRDESTYQSFPPTQVPAGSYLMLGDNRDDSGDFRVIGWVDRDRILGRAHAIAFSLRLRSPLRAALRSLLRRAFLRAVATAETAGSRRTAAARPALPRSRPRRLASR